MKTRSPIESKQIDALVYEPLADADPATLLQPFIEIAIRLSSRARDVELPVIA